MFKAIHQHQGETSSRLTPRLSASEVVCSMLQCAPVLPSVLRMCCAHFSACSRVNSPQVPASAALSMVRHSHIAMMPCAELGEGGVCVM